ncbi:MAG: HupE/UreJ family protein [Acidobacteria bacterium]|nr:HupE/UreJ family protein [Acidobacteriota bacterium]
MQPDTKAAVLAFGFVRGFGLATTLQDFALPRAGLVGKSVALNVGVEVGQSLALGAILVAMAYWRRSAGRSNTPSRPTSAWATRAVFAHAQTGPGLPLWSLR